MDDVIDPLISIKNNMIGGMILAEASINGRVTILRKAMFEIGRNKINGFIFILFLTKSARPNKISV